ncbi:hypothetical protein DFP73DRAFT_530000 [Morchella snyderi]|nr:hypothetical protein DFP73DRAFT_530000 [Morchella snyderi]
MALPLPLPLPLPLISLFFHTPPVNALQQAQRNSTHNALTCGLTAVDIAFNSAKIPSTISQTIALNPSLPAVWFGMCVGGHRGGHAGIVWEVDEIVDAVNRMIEACEMAGQVRVKGMADIGDTRGGVWIEYSDVGTRG